MEPAARRDVVFACESPRHLQTILEEYAPAHSTEQAGPTIHPASAYQTRQAFSGIMGWPFLQLKALPNSSKFCTTPLTRHCPGE